MARAGKLKTVLNSATHTISCVLNEPNRLSCMSNSPSGLRDMVGTTFCYSRAITLRPDSDSESPFSKMESANCAALGRLKRDLNYLFSRVATGQELGSQKLPPPSWMWTVDKLSITNIWIVVRLHPTSAHMVNLANARSRQHVRIIQPSPAARRN